MDPELIRRRGIWALPLIVVVALVVAVRWVAPSVVRERLATSARQRLGLEATAAEVEVGFTATVLRGVELRPPSGGAGVDARVREVRVLGGLAMLAVRGAAGVDAVELDGVDVQLDLAAEPWARLRELLRARGTGTGGADPGPATAVRPIDIKGLDVTLTRGARAVAKIRGAWAQVRGAVASAGADRIEAASERQQRLTLRATRLDAEHVAGKGFRLKRASVGDAVMELVRSPTPPAAPEPSNDDSEALDREDAASARNPGAAADATPVKVAPLAAKAEPEDATGSVLQAFLQRLAVGAELSVKHAVLRQPEGEVLRDAHATIVAQREGELRVTASAAAQVDGRLDVDMRVWPRDLRADGKVSIVAMPLTVLVPVLPSVPWFEPEKSRLDAELSMTTESLERLAIAGHVALRDAAIFAPRIAPLPVHVLDLRVDGKGHWLPLSRRLEVEAAEVRLGAPKVALTGVVELAVDHYAIDVDARLPRTPCTDAVRAIPADLLADMALAEWTGSLSGRVQLAVDSRALPKTKLELEVNDQCEFTSLPALADLRRFAAPFTHSVVEPDDSLFEMETGPGTEAWTPIEAISPFLIYAVLAHEDPQFFAHHGFSPLHIRNALVRNLEAGRYVVGASTITMQLVKNVFLRREKTLARKLQEVLLTWWLERAMDKREILQLYLNVIEYGPGIYGIRNAARHYFNRLPSELSPAEAVFFATILPNPKRFHGFFERGAITPAWAANMRKLVERLRERGSYDAAAAEYGLREIEHFTFTPEGKAAAPRVIAGGTPELPYDSFVPLDTTGEDAPADAPSPDGYD